jgi:peptidoglycan/LPS O-acetylase OafA/YrhL
LLDRLEIAFYWTFSRVDALAVGAYLAASLKRYGSFAPVRQAALRLSTCAGAWVIFVMIQQRGFYNLNPVILLVGVFPTIWLFGAILVIALTPPTRGALHRILQSRVLRFFGKISYGIYVFHWPITLHLKKAWPETSAGFWTQQALFFLIVMTSSIVIAFVSFRYFEEPILQFKHKRTDRDFLVVNA